MVATVRKKGLKYITLHSRHPPGPLSTSSAAVVAASSTVAIVLPQLTTDIAATATTARHIPGVSSLLLSLLCCRWHWCHSCCHRCRFCHHRLVYLGQHGIAQNEGLVVRLGEKACNFPCPKNSCMYFSWWCATFVILYGRHSILFCDDELALQDGYNAINENCYL